jgi:peptidoglycan/LPS O-acetylase OafA/YrhL
VTTDVTTIDETTDDVTMTEAPEPEFEPPVIAPGPEAPAPRRPPRFPAFDGLRAIAAITVVVVHVSFVGGLTAAHNGVGIYTARAEIGVSVFFLISGFLLYRPFVVAHLAAARKPRTGAFWIRRLLRIVPAYWLVLFVATSILHAGPGIGPGGWRAYASHYLFLQIYSPYQTLKGISAAWSLCVEMTFYLYIPLYAALIGWHRSSRTVGQRVRIELIGLAIMIVISFTWRYTVLQFQHGHSPYWHLATIWLPAFLDLFALGMGLAVVSAWMHHEGREFRWMCSRLFPWLSWACAGACFWAVAHIGIPVIPIYTESTLDMARQTLYGAFAFFLLLPAVFGPQGKGLIRRFLQCWPVASLGVISYGIYLWHETWIYQILKEGHYRLFTLEFWAFFFSVLALTILSASLSYFVLEKPILRLKNSITWWNRSRTRSERSDRAAAPTPPDSPDPLISPPSPPDAQDALVDSVDSVDSVGAAGPSGPSGEA